MADPLETILRQCAESAPHPWYPSGYAQANGLNRDDLDPHLDQLRMAGLIQLTDWVQGRGQGYALTPQGQRVMQSPRELARVRAGGLDHPSYAPQEPPKGTGQRMTPFERGEQIRAAFLNPSPPLVSYALILINVAWFLWGISIALEHGDKLNEFLYGSTKQVLQQTGALSGEYLIQGGWNWSRLITCCFVHIGLLHLGVNMYSLWVVGPFFEQLWGRMHFLVLYLIAGLGGSCAMVINDPHILGAGASGALWGILAAYAVWVVLNRRYLPGPMASQMLRQVIIVFVINVAITYGVPNISAAAHFGGGAIGAVTALLLHAHRYGGALLRRLALLGVVAIPVLCVTAVVEAQRLDPRWQAAIIAEVSSSTRQQAREILDQQVQPLLRQKPKAYSLEEVTDAVAGLVKAQGVSAKGISRLRQAGPFQQKELEAKRQGLIQDLENAASNYAVAELEEFILPFIADASRRTTFTYDRQWKVLQSKKKAGELTPEEVEERIAPCRKAREETEASVALLRRAGPFPEQRIERARLRALHEDEEAIQGWKATEQRWREMANKPTP
jgi:membrane associated rhomboid family serine protease